MGTTKFHKNKLILLFIFLVLLCLFSIWRATLLICHNGTKRPPTSNGKYFLESHGKETFSKKLHRSSRDYWEGDGMTEYHAWHYGPKLASRLVFFFRSENASSILDLGGGAGLQGLFASCYDGNLESQKISDGLCATVDLTKPWQNMIGSCLSVGRQIPTFYENEFIANIHNLNRKGVVILLGDGKNPENSKSLSNIKNNTETTRIFENLGYERDEKATQLVQGKRHNEIYSVQVFRKSSEMEFSPNQISPKLSTRELNISVSSYPDVRNNGNFINIALTSCGLDKMEEALTLVKSAILFSQHTKLHAVVFANVETIDLFKYNVIFK